MRKQIVRFGIVVAAVAVVMASEAGPAGAQGRSSQVTTIRAVRHAISPPLSHIRPVQAAKGLQRVMPLLLTHPVPAQHLIKRDPVLQQSTTTSFQPTAGTGFPGIGVGLGNFSDQYIPPDTNGAAGLTQYVQWVNSSFAVFDKSNGSVEYGPAAGNTIWSSLGGACAAYNSGDPIAQFDKQAQRWVLMQPVFTKPYYLCLAVSTTSDATGPYNLYQFAVPNNTKYFPDYPKLAVWTDGYYISFNSFQGNRYLGPTACVVDRSSMLSGSPATMQCANPLGPSYSSLLPSDLDGDLPSVSGTTGPPPPDSPDYYLNFGTNSLNLWAFQVDWSNSAKSSFQAVTSIPVASFSQACGGGACIPQKGTNEQLDSLGDRLMYRLAYRYFDGVSPAHEDLVVSQSVDTGNGNTGIRWYDLRNDTPGTPSGFAVYQQGTYAPDSNYRWMPSIAMDKAGDIAVGYSVSSGSMNPAIAITGRTPGDPSNTLEGETDVVSGSGSQTSYNRWGDYSAMTVDPTNDCTFWYTNEFLKTNGNFNWSTQITSFAFPNCSSGTSSATVSSVSLSSSSVTGGTTLTGNKVTLSAAAPSGGALITFTSSDPTVVPNPPSVTVPQGSTNTTFTVGTINVSSPTSVIITASYNNSNAQATLTVNPASTGGGSFTITASPSTQTVGRNAAATYDLTMNPSGFSGIVNLSVSGLPPQSSASFSPTSVTLSGTTPQSSVLTVFTGAHTPTKTYTLTITGTASSGTAAPQPTAVTLNVQ